LADRPLPRTVRTGPPTRPALEVLRMIRPATPRRLRRRAAALGLILAVTAGLGPSVVATQHATVGEQVGVGLGSLGPGDALTFTGCSGPIVNLDVPVEAP